MKKTIVMSVLTLFASVTLASASATNWTMTVKATDMNGGNTGATTTLGTYVGYTDGVDGGAKGEPGATPSIFPGTTKGTATTLINGATKEGILDLRAPMAHCGDLDIWRVHLYAASNGGPTWDKMKVTVTLGTSSNAPAYNMISGCFMVYTFSGSMIDGGSRTYYLGNEMPSSFVFTIDHPATSFETADILTITAGDLPEPSSALALFSSMAGLGGFALRRRRSGRS